MDGEEVANLTLCEGDESADDDDSVDGEENKIKKKR